MSTLSGGARRRGGSISTNIVLATESDGRNDQLTNGSFECQPPRSMFHSTKVGRGYVPREERDFVSGSRSMVRPSLGLLRGVSGGTNSFVEVANGVSQVHIFSGCPVTSDLPLP